MFLSAFFECLGETATPELTGAIPCKNHWADCFASSLSDETTNYWPDAMRLKIPLLIWEAIPFQEKLAWTANVLPPPVK